MHALTNALLWCSAIGCGLMAGVYFSFSAFIMAALARIKPPAGIAAMNAINTVILKSSFMPLFLGTTVTSAVLALIPVFHWDATAAPAMLVGGILYVVGMFIVTMIFNVPLNNALARVADPASGAATSLWQTHLRDWTRWNHVRTFASLGAAVSFTYALVAR
jgi:uncharacterized membrane protein